MIDNLSNIKELFIERLAPKQPSTFAEGHNIGRGLDVAIIRRFLEDQRIVKALAEILLELEWAEKKHPVWPADPVYAAAVVNEEAGELVQACNNHTEGRKTKGRDSMLMAGIEASHTAVTALRFKMHMEGK